jgi:hypothetical protein
MLHQLREALLATVCALNGPECVAVSLFVIFLSVSDRYMSGHVGWLVPTGPRRLPVPPVASR